jgi:hypothetical protein
MRFPLAALLMLAALTAQGDTVDSNGISATLPKGWQTFSPVADFTGLAVSCEGTPIELIVERQPHLGIAKRAKELGLDKDPGPTRPTVLDTFAGYRGQGTELTYPRDSELLSRTYFMAMDGATQFDVLIVVHRKPDAAQLADLDHITASLRVEPLPQIPASDFRDIVDAALTAHAGYDLAYAIRDGTDSIRLCVASRDRPDNELMLTYIRRDGHWSGKSAVAVSLGGR